MKRTKFIVGLIAASLLLSGCEINWPWRGPKPTALVYLMDAPVGKVQATHTAEGVIVGSEDINVFPKVKGKVTAVYVAAGDVVAKDTVLATINNADASNEIKAIDAAMTQTEAKIKRAQADLEAAKASANTSATPDPEAIAAAQRAADEAEANLKAAIEAHAEVVKKHEQGQVSDEELSASEERGAKAAQALKEANRVLSEARAAKPSTSTVAIESATAALNRANAEKEVLIKARAEASARLKNYSVLSPIEGFVSGVYIRAGETAENTNAPLFTVTSIRPVYVRVQAPAYLRDKLKIGDEAQVAIRQNNFPFTGKIAFIEEPQGTDSPFEVRLSLANEDMQLRPGMTATVELVAGEKPDCVWLPTDAVLNDGTGSYVYAHDTNDIVRLPVTTGIAGNGRVEIISGVQAGTSVVVRGQNLLGDKVKTKIAGKLTPEEFEAERISTIFAPGTPVPFPSLQPSSPAATAVTPATAPAITPIPSGNAAPIPPAPTSPPQPEGILPPARDFNPNAELKIPEIQ